MIIFYLLKRILSVSKRSPQEISVSVKLTLCYIYYFNCEFFSFRNSSAIFSIGRKPCESILPPHSWLNNATQRSFSPKKEGAFYMLHHVWRLWQSLIPRQNHLQSPFFQQQNCVLQRGGKQIHHHTFTHI